MAEMEPGYSPVVPALLSWPSLNPGCGSHGSVSDLLKHCVLHTGLPSAWPQLPGEASYFPHFCLPGRSWDIQDLSQVLKATLVGLLVTPGQF